MLMAVGNMGHPQFGGEVDKRQPTAEMRLHWKVISRVAKASESGRGMGKGRGVEGQS